ncbi:aspartic proteinase nepenthesin-1-like [Phragmites australis]|uniref:aspartic proteinase nepenthesin-1-like n=1 Tax=Phragmites australis TaxID=29695 RepID=UPI002D78E372|nr:aspartic proteinase nepenthesin-1-like [Phragmites australis]
MEMKLTTSLAIITALLVHHLSLTVAAIADHTTVLPNASSAGFSFRLVANHSSIRRGGDGFLHLQHSLRADLPPHPPSVANVTTLRPEIYTTVLPHAVVVDVGTGNRRHEYILRVDASSSLTWLQCKPCEPHAPQHNPIFDPAASPTFHHVAGTSQICQPPYQPVLSGTLCSFHLTGPRGMSVRGYLSNDQFTKGQEVHRDFLFGCSHSTEHFQSEGVYAGVASVGRTPTSLAMQAAARGLTQFSYCLFGGSSKTKRQGFLRFGTDVPRNPRYRTTRILPALDAHESMYYVSLVGISLGSRRLDRIRPETFARRKDGQGGCVIDLGTPLTVMVQEAYRVVEEAVWSDLQRQRAERVKRPGYGLCVRATKAIKGRLQSLSLHFPEENAVLVFSPEQLFLMMNDKQGQIACLAMMPGRRTVIGALQQVDTRFVYDLKNSKLSFASESCSRDTIEAEVV